MLILNVALQTDRDQRGASGGYTVFVGDCAPLTMGVWSDIKGAREATTEVLVYGRNKILNHGNDPIEGGRVARWCGGTGRSKSEK